MGKCIIHALKTRSKERLTKPRYHFLDYAEPKYGKQLVYDVKCLMKILVLYVPFPLFWALFDQQSSRWTFQASQMDGYVNKKLTIKPDQVQVLNPLIVVFCIPLFNLVIYPMLEKVYINTQLRKLALGMALCGAAFFVSGLLELRLEQTYPVQPRVGEGQLRIFNGQPCGFKLNTTLPNHREINIEPNSAWTEKHILLKDNNHNQTSATFQYNATSYGPECNSVSFNGEIQIKSKESISYFLTTANKLVQYTDSPIRSATVLPMIRILMTGEGNDGLATTEIAFQNSNDVMNETHSKFKPNLNALHEVDEGIYFVWIDGSRIRAVELKQGGTYTIVINRISSNDYVRNRFHFLFSHLIHFHWTNFILYKIDDGCIHSS